jgi:hypothetical protein
VRVLQLGGVHDLAEETIGAVRGRQLVVQHLESDRTIVRVVVREVDRGHTTAAKFVFEAIAVAQGAGKLVTDVECRCDSGRGCLNVQPRHTNR